MAGKVLVRWIHICECYQMNKLGARLCSYSGDGLEVKNRPRILGVVTAIGR